MRFYKQPSQPHQFYCGVDLHARTMYLCILDQAGSVVLHQEVPAAPDAFLHAIAPFRDGLVVACECLFCWYWLADLCHAENIAFVLGHALYMKAIHGGKAAGDRIDSSKIAQLLRGGNLPIAYVYPKGLRETRDLLRRRMYLVHKRAEVVAHTVNTNSQYNLPPFGKKLIYARNRQALQVAERFADASVRKSIEVNLRLLDSLDELIGDVELYLERTVKVDDADTFYRLRSIPGVGKILALVLLYEIHDIKRFAREGQFLSYARLIRPLKTSAGKVKGGGGSKIGNAHLKWAFSEAACLLARESEDLQPAAAELQFAESATGCAQLRQRLDQIAQRQGPVLFVIRLDVAGQFADTLLHFLHALSTAAAGTAPAADPARRAVPFAVTISCGDPQRNKTIALPSSAARSPIPWKRAPPPVTPSANDPPFSRTICNTGQLCSKSASADGPRPR